MSAPAAGPDGTNTIGYDVATSLWQGKRPYQEDTLLADFHGGMDRGFAVLADGMGGHAAGDLASRLVVIDAVSHLKFLMHDGAALEKNLHSELTSAIQTANDVLKDRAADDRRLQGMGATFLATVMFEDRLYWASVGDSPLYLWREGKLRQLNEDHSMAPIIDQMAKSGELSEEEAANHPDRNALTSVLMGRSVKSMDVPQTATVLDPGDVLIQASDGLQYLDDDQIAAVMNAAGARTSRQIADALMQALHDLDDPAQDNTAILVLQLTEDRSGGGTVATGTTTAASDGERAVVGVATAAAGVGATATSAAATAVPAPDSEPDPPEKRRNLLVPAALLGGAALALGLIFGLPSTQDDTDLAASDPQAQAEDVVETTDPNPDDPADETLPDPEISATAPDAANDPDASSSPETDLDDMASDDPAAEPSPDLEPDTSGTGDDVAEEAPGADADAPADDAVPDTDPAPEAPAEQPAPDGSAEDEAANADVAPAEIPADPTADADAESDVLQPEAPAPEAAAPETEAAPEREGEPEADTAPAADPATDEAPTEDAPDPEAPVQDPPDPTRSGDVATPEATDGDASDRETGADAQSGVAPAEDLPEDASGAVAAIGATTGTDPVSPTANPTIGVGGTNGQVGAGAFGNAPSGAGGTILPSTPDADTGVVGATPLDQTPESPEIIAAPQPRPLPAPAPAIAAPAPDAAPAPAPGEVVAIAPPGSDAPVAAVPGIGPLREGLSAPAPAADTPALAPNPAPAPQPQQPQNVPRAPLIFDPAISEIGEDDRATQMAPRQPSQPEAFTPQEGVANGATITPMLPPFTGSIQRICQAQQCFAIIRQPDGSVTVLQRRR